MTTIRLPKYTFSAARAILGNHACAECSDPIVREREMPEVPTK